MPFMRVFLRVFSGIISPDRRSILLPLVALRLICALLPAIWIAPEALAAANKPVVLSVNPQSGEQFTIQGFGFGTLSSTANAPSYLQIWDLSRSYWGGGYLPMVFSWSDTQIITEYAVVQGSNTPAIGPDDVLLIKITNPSTGAGPGLCIATLASGGVCGETQGGIISTFAGNGIAGRSGNGGPAPDAELNGPLGISVDSSGNTYIADFNNYMIRMVDPNGIISTVAGIGSNGYLGDGGPATNAELTDPEFVVPDSSGGFYIADSGNAVVRRVESGIISTFAGIDGAPGEPTIGAGSVKATTVPFIQPLGVALDSQGNLYFSDDLISVIYKVDPSDNVSLYAGIPGSSSYSGDGGPATRAALCGPLGIAVDQSNDLYIADACNSVIRKVTGGTISTVAGNGAFGYNGASGNALTTELNGPSSVALDSSGNLFIADNGNSVVRMVDTSGNMTTVAGLQTMPPSFSSSFTGTAAAATWIGGPMGVAVDKSDNLYITTPDLGSVAAVVFPNGYPSTAPVAPAFSAASGSYSGPQTVSISSSTSGATIYYTVGKLAISSTWTAYTGSITVSSSETITAIAVAADGKQNAFVAAYTISALPVTASPKFSPAGGTVSVGTTVTLSDSTQGAKIYWATSPFTSQSSYTLYTGPISIGNSETIYTYAAAPNYSSSATVSATYTANSTTADAPAFSIPAATYSSAQTLTLSDATPGTSIYYATSSATPASSYTLYSGPITISSTETIYAYAAAPGYANSSTVSSSYTLNVTPVIFSISPVQAQASQAITLSGLGLGQQAAYSGSSKYLTVWNLSENWEAGAPGDSIGVIVNTWTNSSIQLGGFSNVGSAKLTAGDRLLVSVTDPASNANPSFCAITVGSGASICAAADAGGVISDYAGGGNNNPCTGSSVAATGATFDMPQGTALDASGNVYISDTNRNVVWKVAPSGSMSILVARFQGQPAETCANPTVFVGPEGIAADPAGNLYVADGSNRILKVDSSGTVTVYAGTGASGYSGDGGPATNATLSSPTGVALDSSGNVYFSDANNNVVRKIDRSQTITTVAGNHTAAYAGDGGQAASAGLNTPWGLAVDASGNLYIADSFNGVIRKVNPSQSISTIAGKQGAPPLSGDGGPATSAGLAAPHGVAVDAAGNLYIADFHAATIRKVSASQQTISTIAGIGIYDINRGDAGLATNGELLYPSAVTLDPSGNLYITETGDTSTYAFGGAIRKVTYPNGQPGNAPAVPAFSVQSGAYSTPQAVSVTDSTAAVTLYYEAGAIDSSTSWTAYTTAIPVAASEPVTAIAVSSSGLQNVATAAYTIITPAAAMPTFSPAPGTYTSAPSVTISNSTPGAAIYYTTDGSTPTATSTRYAGSITVSSTETVKAIAVAAGYTSSAIATATYVINIFINPVPVLNSLSPAIANSGGPAFSITANGSGFVSGSSIYWGSTALATTYVSAAQLTAQVPASNIASSGTSAITVQSPALGGGTSNPLQFEIDSGSSGNAPNFKTAMATVAAGSTASYPVTLPSEARNVTVTCLNLPAGASCSYSSTTSTVSIATSSTTPAGTDQIIVVFTETLPGAATGLILLPFLLLPLAWARLHSIRRHGWITACLCTLVLVGIVAIGCSGGSSGNGGGTPSPQTHIVTSSGVVSLTVQ
jgi:sugar lactone lactonase YvrE